MKVIKIIVYNKKKNKQGYRHDLELHRLLDLIIFDTFVL